MIHYCCDRCRKTINPQEEVRYVVNVEVYAALDPVAAEELEDDRDYLDEIQEVLEALDGEDSPFEEHNGFHRRTYDLCPDCYRKFVQNPMGCDAHARLGFSSN